MSAEGLPLGVVRAQFDAPVPAGAAHKAPEQRKSWRWMEGLRDCAELAARCPDTRVVGVMDREADIFELFEHQRQDPRVELLVRAKNNRRIAGEHKLFERLRAAPERARLHIAVGRQSARPKTSKQKLKTKRKESPSHFALLSRISTSARPGVSARAAGLSASQTVISLPPQPRTSSARAIMRRLGRA